VWPEWLETKNKLWNRKLWNTPWIYMVIFCICWMAPCRQPLGVQNVLGVSTNPNAWLQFALTVTMLLHTQMHNSKKITSYALYNEDCWTEQKVMNLNANHSDQNNYYKLHLLLQRCDLSWAYKHGSFFGRTNIMIILKRIEWYTHISFTANG
jgi:hypothetical protein